MTKEELLALGLTEEQTAKVVEDYGKNYVSKDQFKGNSRLLTAKLITSKNLMRIMQSLRNKLKR